MVIVLDLNVLTESVSAPTGGDTPLDTVVVIATPRHPVPVSREPALAEPPDDDAIITWEDAEWQ